MKTLTTITAALLVLASCTKSNSEHTEKRVIWIDSTNIYIVSETNYECLYDTVVLTINTTNKTFKKDTIHQVVSDSIVENFMTINSLNVNADIITIDPETKTYIIDGQY